MGHTIKGQTPRKYRPSATRRASGLNSINETHENALKLWKKLRNHLKSVVRSIRFNSEIQTKGSVTRGRFKVTNSSPPKRTNIQSDLPTKKRTNAKSP